MNYNISHQNGVSEWALCSRGVRRRLESRVEEIRNYIRRMHRVIEYGNLIDLSPIRYYFIACIFAELCVCAHTIIITQSNVMTARCFVVLPVRKSVICIWRVPKLWGIVYVNVLYIILLLLCAVIHHLLLEENLQIQNQILFLWIFSRYCNSHQVYFVSKYLYIFLIIIFIFPVFFFCRNYSIYLIIFSFCRWFDFVYWN